MIQLFENELKFKKKDMMNLFSREEYIERRKMLLWFLEQFDSNGQDRSVDEMIGFVTDRLGLSYNDLSIITSDPENYRIPLMTDEEEKWIFFYRFLTAMDIGKNFSVKEKEICRVIAKKLEMHDRFSKALISILPQYIRRKLPESIVKYSFGAIKKSMVAAAMLVPLGYVIGTSY